MTWWHIYIFIFLFAACISIVLTPIFIKLAATTGFYDIPQGQEHKKHGAPIPLLGGLAMFASWALCIGLCVIVSKSGMLGSLQASVTSNLHGVLAVTKNLFFIAFGAFLGVLLGLYDDRWNMRAATKLLGQIAIAAIAVTWGNVRISVFMPYPQISWILSVFWIVAIMNSVNFFDNMDGLAVGVATIAFSFFSLAAASNGQYFVATLGAVSAGTALGFWFYNHHPAQMFMGDSGSHFLGYLMAVMGTLVTYYIPSQSLTKFSILIPFFILAIPIFDLFAVVVIRIKNGKPVYIGDHNHISHRFVAMGMSRKNAVLMIHLLAIAIGLSVLPILWGDERTIVVCAVQALTMLCLITLIQVAGKKNNGENKTTI
jgi:UDP-GlcNAc:undecaprenyl-phosphate GlcNAc-1-phosphate transferase